MSISIKQIRRNLDSIQESIEKGEDTTEARDELERDITDLEDRLRDVPDKIVRFTKYIVGLNTGGAIATLSTIGAVWSVDGGVGVLVIPLTIFILDLVLIGIVQLLDINAHFHPEDFPNIEHPNNLDEKRMHFLSGMITMFAFFGFVIGAIIGIIIIAYS